MIHTESSAGLSLINTVMQISQQTRITGCKQQNCDKPKATANSHSSMLTHSTGYIFT